MYRLGFAKSFFMQKEAKKLVSFSISIVISHLYFIICIILSSNNFYFVNTFLFIYYVIAYSVLLYSVSFCDIIPAQNLMLKTERSEIEK